MSEIPRDLRYAQTHEWARQMDDGTIVVGISDHAQGQLGDLVYVEVPEVGRTVDAGEACAVVESVKAASDIYSPAAGEVVESNDALVDAPEDVNTDPYGDGWLFRLRYEHADDLKTMMDADSYRDYVSEDD